MGRFSDGPVVKNPPANAGDKGSISGLGRFHMSWDNWTHVSQPLSTYSRVWEPQLLKPTRPRACALQQENHHMRSLHTATKSNPCMLQLVKAHGEAIESQHSQKTKYINLLEIKKWVGKMEMWYPQEPQPLCNTYRREGCYWGAWAQTHLSKDTVKKQQFKACIDYLGGFLGGSVGKESTYNAGDLGLIPGWGRYPKIRRKWQTNPVFLPGKSHGQRSLAGYIVHGVTQSQTRLSD